MSRLDDAISQKGNCNDCGKRKDCEYLPQWGEQVRMNCSLYKKEVAENGTTE